MKPAIRVENLSKCYRIGTRTHPANRNLTEALASGARGLWRGLTGGEQADADGDGTFWALKDVSFEVQPGEVVGIIGRNGAGKSTLLKVLSRIVEPTGGRCEVRGRMGSLLEVGTGFHPELTGRENVYLNGSVLGMSRREIERKFDEIVAFSEIEKFLDTPVKRYSSGMYVRLAFAVAAHLELEVLVVDEVLAVGDLEFQKKCLGKMGEVAQGGRTVLFVSHNMGAIKHLTRRCLCLKGGQVALDGSPEAAISEYLGTLPITNTDTVDLSEYRRSGNADDGVVIRDLYASTPDMPRTRSVKANQPVTLCAVVEAKRRITGAGFDFALFNARQECLALVYSYDRGARINLDKGVHTIKCLLPSLPYSPGEYYVDAGIAQATGILSWDVVLKVPLFGVVDDFANLEWHNRPWGCFHLEDIDWNVSAGSQAPQDEPPTPSEKELTRASGKRRY
jgi:lipopolysaccharide transport system ATP-binding protein